MNKKGLGDLLLHGMRRVGTVAGNALVGPVQLRINPMSYQCNHKCTMCSLQKMPRVHLNRLRHLDRKEALTLDDYRRLLSDHRPGLINVNVTGGGEPLLHRDIMDIMQEVKKNRLKGSLITNGTLLDSDTVAQLVEMGWDGIRISIHAGDAETYEIICGMDNYEKVIENLTFMANHRKRNGGKYGCRVVLFNVIQRENIHSIDRIFETAETVNADFIEFERLIPFDKTMKLTLQELDEAQDRLACGAENSGIDCNLQTILCQLQIEADNIRGAKPFRPARRCSVGFDQAFITAQGDVFPCCFSNEKMGNVRHQSLKSIWDSRPFKNFRKRLIQGKFAPYCFKYRCALPGVLHNW